MTLYYIIKTNDKDEFYHHGGFNATRLRRGYYQDSFGPIEDAWYTTSLKHAKMNCSHLRNSGNMYVCIRQIDYIPGEQHLIERW